MADNYVQHIIRKQFIDLIVDKRDNIFNLQNELSEYYYSQILPLLEKIFDEISGEGDVISIDRLELDLGRFTPKEFARQIKEGEILQKIEKLLYQQLKVGDHRETVSTVLSKKTVVAGAFEQWMYYMRKGSLPWNLLQIDELWRNRVLENLATDYNAVSLLRQSIRLNDVLIKRIVLQNDPSFLITLVEVLTAIKQESLSPAIQELQKVIEYIHEKVKPISVLLHSKAPEIIWQRILIEASLMGDKGGAVELVEAALLYLLPKEEWKELVIPRSIKLNILGPIIKKIKESFPDQETTSEKKKKRKKNEQAADDRQIENETGKAKRSSTKAKDISKDFNSEQQTNKIEPEKKEIEEIAGKLNIKEEEAIIADRQHIDEEGIFVPFAGVVMTHSFIHSFFKQVNIVSEGKFISLHAQQRGIYLLHYLATGRTEAEEYELVMPKILCSYSVEETINKEINLSEEELSEAKDLLAVLIDHWGAKSISIQALRGNFLTRGGKLNLKNEQLHLVMEKNGVDILLRTFPLPWNMTVIKLPWLQQSIYIEW